LGAKPEAPASAIRVRVLHWECKYPWPLGKRDYILEQSVHTETSEDGGVCRCVQGRTVKDDSVAAPPRGTTRIDDYRANMVIWDGPDGQGSSSFALLYFEDAKMSLPGWALTQMAASTIPSSLAGLAPVAEKYPKMRMKQTMIRMCGSDPASPTRSDVDEDGFYSASDDEDESDIITVPSVAKSSRAPLVAGVASKRKDTVHRGDKDSKRISPGVLRVSLGMKGEDGNALSAALGGDVDLEEGLLVFGKEEREILLQALAQKTGKGAGGRWLPWFLCGPCRRRCTARRGKTG
jgi:hypothetical protein